MSDVSFVRRMSRIPYRPFLMSIGANAMGECRLTVVKDNAPQTTDRARSDHKPTFEKRSWFNALVGNKTTDFSLLQLSARKLSSALLGVARKIQGVYNGPTSRQLVPVGVYWLR